MLRLDDRLALALAITALSPLGCGGSVVTGGTGGAGTSTSSGAGGGSASVTTSATTGAGGATSASSSAGTGGGCGDCGGFLCCGTTCVNKDNDIHNCGGCNIVCPGADAYCDKGTCGKPPCDPLIACLTTGEVCCGNICCKAGELCCDVPGSSDMGPSCAEPSSEGTCAKGCLQCVCASPDTPIATPTGERMIADLAPGDLVYTVRGRAVVAAPILRVNRIAAHDHHVVRVTLDSGRILEISPRHPTAEGRTFADLRLGDRLDGARVLEATLIPYAHPFTHDILPDSDTGTYFAGGVLIGSTLHGRVDVSSTR